MGISVVILNSDAYLGLDFVFPERSPDLYLGIIPAVISCSTVSDKAGLTK